MQISSRFTIGTHVLVMIALKGDCTKVTSDMTLSQLKKAGLIHVARGTGGAEMAKELEAISLLDIYQAVECLGKTGQLFGFHEHPNPACPIGNSIHGVLDGKLEKIQLAMEKEMAQTSLKEVVEQTTKQMELATVS